MITRSILSKLTLVCSTAAIAATLAFAAPASAQPYGWYGPHHPHPHPHCVMQRAWVHGPFGGHWAWHRVCF